MENTAIPSIPLKLGFSIPKFWFFNPNLGILGKCSHKAVERKSQEQKHWDNFSKIPWEFHLGKSLGKFTWAKLGKLNLNITNKILNIICKLNLHMKKMSLNIICKTCLYQKNEETTLNIICKTYFNHKFVKLSLIINL